MQGSSIFLHPPPTPSSSPPFPFGPVFRQGLPVDPTGLDLTHQPSLDIPSARTEGMVNHIQLDYFSLI